MEHILVVEDGALVSSALQVLFEAHGYKVSIACDIATGLEYATQSSIDIMLLDLTLPDGDGLSLLTLLRERDALPRATLALTGHDNEPTRVRCLAAGCQSVLIKPFPVRDLVELVRSL